MCIEKNGKDFDTQQIQNPGILEYFMTFDKTNVIDRKMKMPQNTVFESDIVPCTKGKILYQVEFLYFVASRYQPIV